MKMKLIVMNVKMSFVLAPFAPRLAPIGWTWAEVMAADSKDQP